MRLHRTLFILFTLLLFGGASFAQSIGDIVYLKNGGEYHGRVISVSPETVLLQMGVNIIPIDASEVRSIGRETIAVAPKPKAQTASAPRPKREHKPLDRKVLVELRGGLALIEPIGMEATMGILHRMGKRNALGISTGFMVSNRSVFSGFLEYRRYFSDPGVSRFFVGLRPGIALRPWDNSIFQPDNFFGEITYSPLKFLGAQGGWLLDSGVGLAMSMNLGLNFIWFDEELTQDFGSTTSVTNYYLLRPQASLSLIF